MEITHIVLGTRSLAETASFYEDVLGLHVVREPGEITIAVGANVVVFQERGGDEGNSAGVHHLAFTIPTGSLAAARTWLETRTALLARDGEVEFEGPPSWNSRSVYFDGPDGSVLELIERRELDNGVDGPFGPDRLLCVSEVGVAVPDVLGAVRALEERGVAPYANPPSATFAPVGDAHGLIILVAPGRPWFPTQDRVSARSRVKIAVAAGRTFTF